MTVCSGPSGSGKSSLAIDTLYAEGQRRYVESLSSYARQFLAPLQKPKVEHISGLSPAVSIEQKTTSKSPEVHRRHRDRDPRLPCGSCSPGSASPTARPAATAIGTQTADEIVEKILHLPEGTKVYVMAPGRPPGQRGLRRALGRPPPVRASARVRVDDVSESLDSPPRAEPPPQAQGSRWSSTAPWSGGRRDRGWRTRSNRPWTWAKGVVHVARVGDEGDEARWPVERYSQHRSCDGCGRSFEELSPHHFSFNAPIGWCPVCEGSGDPARRQPRGPDPRRPAVPERRGRSSPGRSFAENPAFARMIGAMAKDLANRPGHPLRRPRRPPPPGDPPRDSGDAWFAVPAAIRASPSFSFQYKGLFPGDRGGRPGSRSLYRHKLQGMVDDVPCVSCSPGGRGRPRRSRSDACSR